MQKHSMVPALAAALAVAASASAAQTTTAPSATISPAPSSGTLSPMPGASLTDPVPSIDTFNMDGSTLRPLPGSSLDNSSAGGSNPPPGTTGITRFGTTPVPERGGPGSPGVLGPAPRPPGVIDGGAVGACVPGSITNPC